MQGYVHQFHLEGDVGLVTFADDQLVAVDVHNIVRRQVLHVNEREGGKAYEYKDVTNESQIIILAMTSSSMKAFASKAVTSTIRYGMLSAWLRDGK